MNQVYCVFVVEVGEYVTKILEEIFQNEEDAESYIEKRKHDFSLDLLELEPWIVK